MKYTYSNMPHKTWHECLAWQLCIDLSSDPKKYRTWAGLLEALLELRQASWRQRGVFPTLITSR